MARDHEIALGDHVVRLAYRHGHATVDAVWNHPANMSLRDMRPDAGVLAIGDIVHVPDAPPRIVSGLLTRRDHEIVLELPLPMLRLRLLRPSNVGYADIETRVVVDDFNEGFIPDADGTIEFELGPDTRTVALSYAGEEVDVDVAWLQPVDELEGWHARLENLGYEPGGLQGEHARDAYALRSAIEEFQCDHGLPVDGMIGPMTNAKLMEVHGA
jgi:hypothetical protein